MKLITSKILNSLRSPPQVRFWIPSDVISASWSHGLKNSTYWIWFGHDCCSSLLANAAPRGIKISECKRSQFLRHSHVVIALPVREIGSSSLSICWFSFLKSIPSSTVSALHISASPSVQYSSDAFCRRLFLEISSYMSWWRVLWSVICDLYTFSVNCMCFTTIGCLLVWCRDEYQWSWVRYRWKKNRSDGTCREQLGNVVGSRTWGGVSFYVTRIQLRRRILTGKRHSACFVLSLDRACASR